MSKFCPKCGAQLDDSVYLCATCGASVGSPTFQQPTETHAQAYNHVPNDYNQSPVEHSETSKNKPKTKVILISVITSIVLVGVIVCILFATGVIGKKGGKVIKTPEELSVEFMNAFIDGRVDDALEYYAPFLDKDDSRDEFDTKSLLLSLSPEGEAGFGTKTMEVEELSSKDCKTLTTYLHGIGYNVTVTEAQTVAVIVYHKLWGIQEFDSCYITYIKYGGKWYILSVDASELNY